ncbi:linker for activation of T-cells family member 1 isoform X1 [Dromiciops gliroides]|uniref:linker for activation of T-cells family member 1 isoform X1 n=1 Tax=Dromiciops gliroides TaxID=33562 RepID=UPI001CC47CFD|nr:linker for activation of T-cells family member 1 isoform X1 [Dromiciops gliroides]
METTPLGPSLLWLLVLLFPALLVTVLCLCCRDLPGPNSEVSPSDGSYHPSGGLVILKRPCGGGNYVYTDKGMQRNLGRDTNVSWPPPAPCQLDLPIPRSPQHPGLSHRIPSSQPEPDSRSEPSYENEGISNTTAVGVGLGLLGEGEEGGNRSDWTAVGPPALILVFPPELEPEDADEEDDYHNEGYLVVLPDGSPNSSAAPLSSSAPNLGSPGLRDSPSSMAGGEDYVNIPDSKEASLGGSCEYVNVPEVQEERTSSNRTPVTDQDGEEEGPDYENVQEQSGHSFT